MTLVPAVDRGFQDYQFEATLRTARVAVLASAIVYSLFYPLDYLVAPSSHPTLWLIRILYTPVFFLVFGLSFTRGFRRYYQFAFFALLTSATLSILFMMGALDPAELGYRTYYSGLMVVSSAGFLTLRLPFRYLVAYSLFFLGGFLYLSLAVQELHRPGMLPMLMNSGFFVISSLCLGLIGAVALEHYSRRDYLNQGEIREQKRKSDALLLSILPDVVATELKETRRVRPVLYESATVLFTDFSGFTRISASRSPGEVIAMLDECFSGFDEIIEGSKIEKLKTIGDAYMAAAGLPVTSATHAIDAALAALRMLDRFRRIRESRSREGDFWDIRIGIHTGPLIAGVIGSKKFSYDIWGDTVNTASRIEQASVPGRINLSGETVRHLERFFDLEPRGVIESKDKGPLPMWFLLGLKPEFREDATTPNRAFWSAYGEIEAGGPVTPAPAENGAEAGTSPTPAAGAAPA